MVNIFWKGFKRYDFTVDGRDGLVVVPETAADGNPWVWRAEFFDAFAMADMAMLRKGWHLAYYNVSNMYGCPEAVMLMRGFHGFVEAQFNLSKKTVLFGFSRGGLYAFNYAVQYPDKVAALYLDAPVLDIRSWPGGMGVGKGSGYEWGQCLECYGLTEESLKYFKGNPIDKIEQVSKASIPIIIVAGNNDSVVPFDENSAILARRYSESGEKIKVIVKQGAEHHPHSLEDPTPIVDFLLNES